MTGFDPIGPGTPAWDASEKAIAAALRGASVTHGVEMDRMLYLLREAGAREGTIDQWRNYVAERIATPEVDNTDTNSEEDNIIVIDLDAMTPSSLVILRAAFMEACNTTTSSEVADTFTRLETRVGNKLCDMWPMELIRRTYNFAFHKRFRKTQ